MADEANERIVYVNGEFVPESAARISVFDRGFLFADAVYEVTSVLRGQLVENAPHLARLERSLSELKMTLPAVIVANGGLAGVEAVQRELVERNALEEGVVYLQVSRGTADRDFGFPAGSDPTLVMFTQQKSIIDSAAARNGIAVKTVDDIRWMRRDIKTVQLLAASLAKQAAMEEGFDDAWVCDGEIVNEASSANAYIVQDDGTIVTRHLGNEILHGITRAAVLKLCETHGYRVEERPFTVEEAYAAREAFITSASSFVYPVVRINDRVLGNGVPGPVAAELRKIYIDTALASLDA
ncbi:MAG: D-amino-acid transaminase [Pseudomonadota bacterium]